MALGQLTGLKDLDLNYNYISSLPKEFGGFRLIEKLNLAYNEFDAFPPEILNLTKLRSLSLNHNRISVIPHEIHRLKALRTLSLNNNIISDLPKEIGRLRELVALNLSNNNLTRLPSEIKQIPLRYLDISNNPTEIPIEITEKKADPYVILDYFFTHLAGTKKKLNEAKVLLVGQGFVGKTSIVERILHNTFNQNQDKTEGISINRWQVKGNKIYEFDSQIKLNIWDFGGQEIMHATHQFFLTKRSLYLLVLDSRLTQEENRVEYWLKIIESFGGESPVLIVGNKIDQHPLDINRTGLQKKYPNIVGILETSAATGSGIEALKAAITEQVNNLPHVRDLLPETWFTVKTKLERLGQEQNFITYDEYLDLCAENEVSDETSQRTLISFLHDLGVILHFQDDPRLEALGILNPQWVTNGVYKILNSHVLFQNRGTLTVPILNKILSHPEYPRDKRLFIVDMMKKFELCYDIEPDKSFLIPDLLPKDELYTGEWYEALAFQIHYSVLPSSIITRFIVRMNAFIHKTVWRSGVVLISGGNTALVKADTEDRKIYIWISGNENTRRDFLSAIRMDFDAIHKTLAKIEATEKVPHPVYPELVFDYSELIEFEGQGVDEIPKKVGSQVMMCNVHELLDGVRLSKTRVKTVFISYAHRDKTFTKKLANELEARGMKVWWDFDRLKGGQDWQKEIERAIKLCNFFLVILTPDGADSEWVGNEITYALQAQKIIIPLILKKCEVPISLIKKQYIDFGKQTRKVAIEKLVEVLKIQSKNLFEV